MSLVFIIRIEFNLYYKAFKLVPEPTQSLIQCVLGSLCPGVKQPEREVEHTPPSVSGVRNEQSYTSTPSCAFMAALDRSYIHTRCM